MATVAQRGRNEPPPPTIIVKKIIEAPHAAHHGGAWKIAYADFITAMMAFFLLMWLVGATDEQQRQGLADYFTPTLINYKENSAGSSGIMSGESVIGRDNYANKATQTGTRSITIPRDATGGEREGSGPKWQETQRFAQLKAELMRRIDSNPATRPLRAHISFTSSEEGLRIDLVDEADFSMFEVGTDHLTPQARELVAQVGETIRGTPNRVIVRGHTDGRAYQSGAMNNWMLSTARAESTRAVLERGGVTLDRFMRIEGVADREPFVAGQPLDPRNRRISVTLASRVTPAAEAAAAHEGAPAH